MSDDSEGFLLEVSTNSSLQVIVEADSRVVYAYLVDGGDTIVGDVWLSNVRAAPEVAPWKSGGCEPPFENPRHLVRVDRDPPTISESSDFEADWVSADAVDLWLAGEWIARLAVGAKPGWSVMAAANGPLARRLEDVERHDVSGH